MLRRPRQSFSALLLKAQSGCAWWQRWQELATLVKLRRGGRRRRCNLLLRRVCHRINATTREDALVTGSQVNLGYLVDILNLPARDDQAMCCSVSPAQWHCAEWLTFPCPFMVDDGTGGPRRWSRYIPEKRIQGQRGMHTSTHRSGPRSNQSKGMLGVKQESRQIHRESFAA